MRTEFEPSRDALVNQLPALGIDPTDVRYAILSHLHWDHAGGMRDFPAPTSSSTGMNGMKPLPARASMRRLHQGQFEGAGLDVHLVSTDPGKPYLSFPASYDVFDDGTMMLVDVPGPCSRAARHGGQPAFWQAPLPHRRFLLFPGQPGEEGPKIRLMRALVKEGSESEETLERLWHVMKDEPDLEMVPCHDYRIPGRFELARAHTSRQRAIAEEEAERLEKEGSEVGPPYVARGMPGAGAPARGTAWSR